MEPKRLYRSRENRVLCGVCGGIAEYFNVDPVLIRLGMVLFICASVGTGLLACFIASVIMPDQKWANEIRYLGQYFWKRKEML